MELDESLHELCVLVYMREPLLRIAQNDVCRATEQLVIDECLMVYITGDTAVLQQDCESGSTPKWTRNPGITCKCLPKSKPNLPNAINDNTKSAVPSSKVDLNARIEST